MPATGIRGFELFLRIRILNFAISFGCRGFVNYFDGYANLSKYFFFFFFFFFGGGGGGVQRYLFGCQFKNVDFYDVSVI